VGARAIRGIGPAVAEVVDSQGRRCRNIRQQVALSIENLRPHRHRVERIQIDMLGFLDRAGLDIDESGQRHAIKDTEDLPRCKRDRLGLREGAVKDSSGARYEGAQRQRNSERTTRTRRSPA